MDTRRGNEQRITVLLRNNRTADALQAKVLQLRNSDGVRGGQAAADSPAVRMKGIQQLIVAVEDRQAVGPQILKNLRLGPQNVLPAAKMGEMHIIDNGDHRHVWPDGPAQIANLSEFVHARLDDRRLMLFRQGQQRQRRADVAVEVSRCLEGTVPLGQDARQQLFISGLSHAAGDLDNGDVKLIPVPGGKVPQGQLGVLYQNICLIVPDLPRQSGAEATRRPPVQRHIDIVMAVKPLPRQGYEPSPGGYGAAVRRDVGNYRMFIAEQCALHGFADLRGGCGDHGHIPPVLLFGFLPGGEKGVAPVVPVLYLLLWAVEGHVPDMPDASIPGLPDEFRHNTLLLRRYVAGKNHGGPDAPPPRLVKAGMSVQRTQHAVLQRHGGNHHIGGGPDKMPHRRAFLPVNGKL